MGRMKKLELTWVGKDESPKLEPRILIEDPALSVLPADGSTTENMLIHGDNLLALKALEQDFTGRIKCIYIDPPFNTGQAFEHYDDGIEHSLWLTMMRARLVLLHRLLDDRGTLFVHIDDNELAYLIVMADEIFGRSNRVSVITFKQSSVSGPKAINPGFVSTASYIVVYAKQKSEWKSTKVYAATERDDRYSKFIENYEAPSESWRLTSLKDAFARSKGVDSKALRKGAFESELDTFVLENAHRVVRTARIAPKDVAEDVRPILHESSQRPGRVFRAPRPEKGDVFFLSGEQLIFYSSKVREVNGQLVTAQALSTIWDDLLSNNLHNEGGVDFPKGKKPELLIKRCLDVATDPGDWVLDSFGGSGTTAAVAHKMGRRWITIELRDHAITHCLPRLKAVADGSDRSGATDATGWRGGGGFRFHTLAPSMLERDTWGNWIINREYNARMLAEAMCKHESFRYAPTEVWWQHGHSSERDFIYVTTQTLSQTQLEHLSHEVGDARSLLICCGAFRSKADAFPNLTLKKIPHAVLQRCEWGRDDYSLQLDLRVENTPKVPNSPAPLPVVRLPSATSSDAPKKRGRPKVAKKPDDAQQANLPEKDQA